MIGCPFLSDWPEFLCEFTIGCLFFLIGQSFRRAGRNFLLWAEPVSLFLRPVRLARHVSMCCQGPVLRSAVSLLFAFFLLSNFSIIFVSLFAPPSRFSTDLDLSFFLGSFWISVDYSIFGQRFEEEEEEEEENYFGGWSG